MDYEALAGIIAAPFIVFMVFVAPIWLFLHYRSKRQVSQGLSADEMALLTELANRSEKMADRLDTLERILSEEMTARGHE
ncbi:MULTISPECIES: envelope stress response membrane protein PspB [Corallincola]|uniref:Envelope stress response membrane protein PspB n=3 Tax=Corallincola TaxID=1775176 RepID=A0A368N0P4_9GAMM|nr:MULTISPECIES: envelope stress response membrane protein PspB [Corallincola]RCU43663.1 envelope stress response membrane protein PspB [Corallincola holothuriorum]TAA42740.1 envelope stress response membrane protein PspB [Corallincola spongiicola]TCI01609.1 envelope stress response membrane protein PspB [Corallincola luteus]